MSIAPDVIAKLVCPVSRTPLRLSEDRTALESDTARLAYPVRNGVPILLARAAQPLD
ncbi:MAG: Trm112 family protein [Sphingobium sp.]|uniref:Trm112 family protein n=1 Tax=Sphingobium sp. CECT 9361 TaxID=2845384 RepID=UPI001E369B1D|nr:Trm112 family protein [Sphingobium sp. CECT 9361]CAH0351862.1 hypothetical protein SPH9361_01651 [Sphingobium sp. CECT 9361]|tara:strand:+ start:1792 stop:1962 length:171 start_codon:yes stop_codon:yes gene_type:complete